MKTDIIRIIEEFRKLPKLETDDIALIREIISLPQGASPKKATQRQLQRRFREPRGFELPKGWCLCWKFIPIAKRNFIRIDANAIPQREGILLRVKRPFYIPVNIPVDAISADNKDLNLNINKGYLIKIACLTNEGLTTFIKLSNSKKKLSKRILSEIFDKMRVRNLHRTSEIIDEVSLMSIFPDKFDVIDKQRDLYNCLIGIWNQWNKLKEIGYELEAEKFMKKAAEHISIMEFGLNCLNFYGTPVYPFAEFTGNILRDFVNDPIFTRGQFNYFKRCFNCGSFFWKTSKNDRREKYCSKTCSSEFQDWLNPQKSSKKKSFNLSRYLTKVKNLLPLT